MLSVATYRVTFQALEPLDLPAYLGSTLRGAFGHAFRQLCCPARPAEPCPVPESCPYHLVFETAPPPGADALRTHEDIPRPFVIAPPAADDRSHPAGATIQFALTLIGRARAFFPHFVVALREVDRIGRGRRAVRLTAIDAVQPLTGATAPSYRVDDVVVTPHDFAVTLADCARTSPGAGPVRVEFVTQTRLVHDGRVAHRPEFQVVFRRLLGRLSSMARFHCGAPLDVDFRGLIEQAGSVRLLEEHTSETRLARFSSRQGRRMEWGGILGTVTYAGEMAPFWPYLVFGQWTHVGKGATFGLGGYRLKLAGDVRG